MLRIKLLSLWNRQPVADQLVMLDFLPPYGGWTVPVKTDSLGTAVFEGTAGQLILYVNGESIYEGFLEEEAIFYLKEQVPALPVIPYWWSRLTNRVEGAWPQVPREDVEKQGEVYRSLPPANTGKEELRA